MIIKIWRYPKEKKKVFSLVNTLLLKIVYIFTSVRIKLCAVVVVVIAFSLVQALHLKIRNEVHWAVNGLNSESSLFSSKRHFLKYVNMMNL